MKKRVLILLVLLVAALALTGCGGKKVDVKKLYVIETDGMDGFGQARVVEDMEYLVTTIFSSKDLEKLGGKNVTTSMSLSQLERAMSDLDMSMDDLINFSLFFDSMDYTLEADNGHLKNGDTIKLIISANEEAGKKAGIKLSSNEIKHKVKGLQELEKVNPFDGVEVKFEGSNGYGRAVIDTAKANHTIKFTSDGKNLKNGDTVSVVITENEEYWARQGYALKETAKDFKVSGLDEVKQVDAFEGVSLTFKGYDKMGRAEISSKNDLPFQYKVDKTSNLSNGDTVVVSLSTAADAFGDRGIVAQAETKEFTVVGLEELIEISEEELAAGYKFITTGAVPKLEVAIDSILEGKYSEFVTYTLEKNDNEFGGEIVVKANLVLDGLAGIGYTADKAEYRFITPIEDGAFAYYITDVNQLSTEQRQEILEELKNKAIAKGGQADYYGHIFQNSNYFNPKLASFDELTFMSAKKNIEDLSVDFGSYSNKGRLSGVNNYLILTANFTSEKGDGSFWTTVYNIVKKTDGNYEIDWNSVGSSESLMEKDALTKLLVMNHLDRYRSTTISLEDFVK